MRYHEISVRTWVSSDFRSLSQDGQMLWLFFLSGPVRTPLPGLYNVGTGACLDHFKWDPDKFQGAFGELADNNMLNFDAENNIVHLPNWMKYNRPPSNPNVMKSWLSILENYADCALKDQYIEELSALVALLDKKIQAPFKHWCAIFSISTSGVKDMEIDYDQ